MFYYIHTLVHVDEREVSYSSELFALIPLLLHSTTCLGLSALTSGDHDTMDSWLNHNAPDSLTLVNVNVVREDNALIYGVRLSCV